MLRIEGVNPSDSVETKRNNQEICKQTSVNLLNLVFITQSSSSTLIFGLLSRFSLNINEGQINTIVIYMRM